MRTPNTMTNKVNTLVVQRILTPYRLSFFQELTRSKYLNPIFVYGQAHGKDALESVREPHGLYRVLVHNISLLNGKALWQRRLIRVANSEAIDVLIVPFNPRLLTNFVLLLIARMKRKPIIWWGHGLSNTPSDFNIWLRLRMLKLADAAITYNDVMRERLIRLNVPAEKLFVARNSIDTNTIRALRKNVPQNERRYILFIGRLIPEKKVDLLIRAFALASQRLPDISLLIVGNGPELRHLQDLVKSLEVEKLVEFVGSTYEEEQLAQYFNKSLVSVSPGYVGLSSIHSLAYGVPLIIARDEPHRPEVTSLKNGYNSVFFDSDRADQLATVLVEYATNPDQQKVMQANAVKSVEDDYSVESMRVTFERAVAYSLSSKKTKH